ncbi:MAG: FtsW/RodA/SpoVE family cell cycle protein [Patescibacteria group bacterium]|nr:FtsW/RodA/SpoVE family cell cycle protein [Patescibacteria group bacterium]
MKRPFVDWQLLLPAIIILIFGLAAIFSISAPLGFNQLIFAFLGLIAFLVFASFPYDSHRYLVWIYAFISILLLILAFLFGTLTRGTVRWLQLGSLTIQPSEIIKPFLIIIFSHFLSVKTTLFRYSLLLILPVLLIFKQPDLGSALVIIAIWLGILISSKLSLFALIIITFLGFMATPLVWHQLQPYQQQRIISFSNPYADPKISGYHSIQSVIAVGSGGLRGKGLGYGPQSQLNFLPERHTDFIFASLAESWGFLGSTGLLIAYFFLLKRLLFISRQAPDQFSRLLGVGIFTLIFFQFTVNVGMNLGLLPITGITLPLVSSGGSSLLATAISLGLAHNLSRHLRLSSPLEIK